MKVLAVADRDTLMTTMLQCRRKGGSDRYVLLGALRFIANLGMTELTLQSDGEPAILAVQRLVAKELREKHGIKVHMRTSPRHSHASAALVESMVRHARAQYRTLRHNLERMTGGQIETTSDLHPWMVRHAPWLQNRFQPRVNEQSSYFAVHGREYRTPMIPVRRSCHV